MTRAVSLGGGGATGIAWEFGILAGLQGAGIDLGSADIIIGTSAGSVVGAVLASGLDLQDAVAYQRAARPAPAGAAAPVDVTPAVAAFALLADRSVPRAEAVARIGAMALAAHTGDERDHLDRLGAQLPVRHWPDRDLRITAVDTANGRLAVFDRGCGVTLLAAVAASCAVPCVFPPVTIDGRRYMDGGVHSATNADLATGASAIVVVAPTGAYTREAIHREIATSGAARSVVVEPDTEALEAFGPNALDGSRRGPAVEAGLRQAETIAEEIRAVWSAA